MAAVERRQPGAEETTKTGGSEGTLVGCVVKRYTHARFMTNHSRPPS
jgi:hypothetical protein